MTHAAIVPPYPLALAPVVLGGVSLRNHVFVSAHTTNFGNDFLPSARHVAYHRERARGGVGLIITEPLRVHDTSLGRSGGLSSSREGLTMLTALTTAIRDEGAAVFSQLTHAGRHSENTVRPAASWGPSPLPHHIIGQVPHAMGRSDLREVRRAYGHAARLARDAGFQGVEIHFGHGHLLHQFISPASNSRTDIYGGDEQSRLRFPMEVLQEVIDAIGDELVVGVRMSADELLPGGQDLAFGCRIAAQVDSLAGVDFLNVSIASYTVPSIGHHVADMSEGRTPYLQQTLEIARECQRIQVLMACRVVDLADAERVLASGPITAVAMTRAHIADPYLIRNALAGAESDTRPCVSCNYCIEQIGRHRSLTCMMNPTVGREQEWSPLPQPALQPQTILVIGGGPAGMECARVAAQRGHRVDLWEQETELGGQVRIGRTAHGRHELSLLKEYEERQLQSLGVRVRTGRPATVEEIVEAAPDTVIIASGARQRHRSVPGWGPAVSVVQALAQTSWIDRVILILDLTGNWTSLSIAETIAERGGLVHLITPASTPLWSVPEYSRMVALQRLQTRQVEIHTASDVEFDNGTAHIHSQLNSGTTTIPGVTDVIPVAHLQAMDQLVEPLRDLEIPTVLIGDAMAPRSLFESIYEGHAAGRNL